MSETQPKVIVGISGGIDSAVAALKLKAEGHDVIGCHLALNPIDDLLSKRLELIKEKVGIPIEIKSVRQEFESTVISYFRNELVAGRSPSPCAICNPLFKWKILLETANSHNAEFAASGHYVQKIELNNNWHIQQGIDKAKDQSYYFWNMNQNALKRILFPLGEQTKAQTKEIAKKYGLEFLVKEKESTGLCFSEGLSYSDLIKKHVPETFSISEGFIIDKTGKTIGHHKGYIYYTIGQKRDLEFFEPSDSCVIAIDSINNRIVAGSPKDLWVKEFKISNCNFNDVKRAMNCDTLSVKIRGFGWNPAGYCAITNDTNNNYTVKLEKPAWAPAPGQPAVFYNDNILLGGALIT
jgi:tRNA-specific 2-thiouridylase